MSDDEQPVATRAAISRTTQACQRCRSLKTRCLPSSQSGTCQRCFGSRHLCAWADTPRRARKLRAPSRIAQVEQKIDGLVSSLINSSTTQSTENIAQAPAPADRRCPSVLGGDFAPQANQGRRPAASGSWISFSESSEERLEPPEKPVEQAEEGEDATDRQYIEQIRRIHSFDDSGEHTQYSGNLFGPSKRREEPIDHAVIGRLLETGEAETLLKEYACMSLSFPFVPLSPDVSAQQLHKDSPMLFLAMITAASWREHQLQMDLDVIYRQELANRTIIRPRRNLSLVQSVLVYLSWYHFVFSHKTQQIFFLHHLVIGLALDIGIHRDFQPMFFTNRQKTQHVDAREKRERQRAFLGCYYLASMVSASLQKPNLLKHNSDMTEWAQELKCYGEFATDGMLGHLVSLRKLEDQVQETLFTGSGAESLLTDARIVMHVRYLEAQFNTWKREIKEVEHERLLALSYAYADMMLHSVALRPLPESTQPSTTDGAQVKALFSTLEAARKFLDTLLSFPASEYHLISFAEWMRLPATMMTVAKLCIPTNAHAAVGWDVKAAQDLARLDICLEALCYRFQNHSTYDKVKQPHLDFWWAMRMMTDLTRTWYVRKIKPHANIAVSNRPIPSGSTVKDRLGADTGALPTPPDGYTHIQFTNLENTDFSNIDLGAGANREDNDPFAFIKSVDFDMEQFFDMGIWGDEAYNGMGFGGGSMPF